jgi:hypothetical protein
LEDLLLCMCQHVLQFAFLVSLEGGLELFKTVICIASELVIRLERLI